MCIMIRLVCPPIAVPQHAKPCTFNYLSYVHHASSRLSAHCSPPTCKAKRYQSSHVLITLCFALFVCRVPQHVKQTATLFISLRAANGRRLSEGAARSVIVNWSTAHTPRVSHVLSRAGGVLLYRSGGRCIAYCSYWCCELLSSQRIKAVPVWRFQL